MASPVLGLQVYTVRQSLSADFVGTLQKVREIGYDAVELCGTGPYSGAQVKEICDDLGLRVAGMHIGLDALERDLAGCITLAHDLGMENLVCPYLPEERRKTRDDWLRTAQALDAMGRQCRKQGMRLSYHNHSFEFVRFDDRYALDLLFEYSSGQNLCSELDTYWVKHGGADPVAYIRKYAGRISILHCKDMAADRDRSFTEVGSGVLDWNAIHRAAVEAGVEWYCVEQDVCPGDPMDSARISAQFMRSKLGL
jgi:sugar phosphate isomerase/epimerase